VRLTDKLNPQKNLNTDEVGTKFDNLTNIYTKSGNNQASYTNTNRFINSPTTFPLNHNPVLSSNNKVHNLDFDRTFVENSNPTLLQSKEESAPNIIFETY
jgi:hypothetical protein